MRKCKEYVEQGYDYAVDLDLEKFFDTVNHSKLIEIVSRTVKDGRVISLIHKYLNAGVMAGGMRETSYIGVPQGVPLSPLLSNIMLNELDRELERRQHRFVRYADDLVILCRSERAGERILANIRTFIERKLMLKVNMDKMMIKEPPYAERHVRWCERSERPKQPFLLLDRNAFWNPGQSPCGGLSAIL